VCGLAEIHTHRVTQVQWKLHKSSAAAGYNGEWVSKALKETGIKKTVLKNSLFLL
jgi:hypothetical protein